MRSPLPWLAVTLALVSTMLHADPVYRWKDAAGQVHYGDQPPRQAEQLNPGHPNRSAPASASSVAPSSDSAASCKAARADLDRYRNATSITETDALGHRHEYTEDERKDLIERTQARVTAACGDSNDAETAGTADAAQ